MIKVEFRGKHGTFAYQTLHSAAADLCAQEPPLIVDAEHPACWKGDRWVLNSMDICCIPSGLFIVKSEMRYLDMLDNLQGLGPIKRVKMVPYLEITPRSGLALRKGLSSPNSPAVIDADYTQEICFIAQNLGREIIEIFPGDRIAQIKGCYAFIMGGAEIIEKPRTGGFGSTSNG